MSNMLRRFLIGFAATVSVVLMTALPAEAAPYWQPYQVTSNWHCSSSPDSVPVGNGSFLARACLVRSGGSIQSVMTITNTSTNATQSFGEGLVRVRAADNIGGTVLRSDTCLASQLSPGQTRACFGKTINRPSPAWAEVALKLGNTASLYDFTSNF